MKRRVSFLGFGGLCFAGTLLCIGGFGPNTASATDGAAVEITGVEELQSAQGGGSGGGGCSGCFCCFPRTPDGNLSLNGFEATDSVDKTVYTAPADKWFILTDLEVVVLDEFGDTTNTYNVGLYEIDEMGMRTLKRWANCSAYHSARGIAIRPGCDVTLGQLTSIAPNPASGEVADQYYWQLNGYLWDGASSGH